MAAVQKGETNMAKDELIKRIKKGKGLPPIGKETKQKVLYVGRGSGKSFIINLVAKCYEEANGDMREAIELARKEIIGMQNIQTMEECEQRQKIESIQKDFEESSKRLAIVANKATVPSHEFVKRLRGFASRS